ncbi:unnamed protein product [Blepharisma stoltei]|uniref:Uncharacterized protein n=1 Tax=Blepharisma stoltei TaxID=1481888 RepID=A0AAU9IIF5_9CILI|nr:unnamed protein product [Blepharisma stoltei]
MFKQPNTIIILYSDSVKNYLANVFIFKLKMGCIETRGQPSEELAVIFAERGLQLHLISSKKTDSIFRKYSYNSKLNQSQLKRVSENLLIPIKNYSTHKNITEMYLSLKGEDGDYKLYDLLIIGVMLSKSDPKTKSRLLFQIFDEKSENKINFPKLKTEIIPSILKHCCVTLPSLVCKGQSNMANEMKNVFYVEKLKKGFQAASKLIAESMAPIRTIIDEEIFVNFFVTFRNGLLLAPQGVRAYVSEVSDTLVDEHDKLKLPKNKENSHVDSIDPALD